MTAGRIGFSSTASRAGAIPALPSLDETPHQEQPAETLVPY